MNMVDMLEVKQAEQRNGCKFSLEEIEIARYNEGVVGKKINGRVVYFKFALINFPYDLLTEQQKQKASEGIFYDSAE